MISCNNPSEKEEGNTKVEEVFVEEDQLSLSAHSMVRIRRRCFGKTLKPAPINSKTSHK